MSGHGTPIPMTARAGNPLKGIADVPGDKSISHRSLILGALSVGETTVDRVQTVQLLYLSRILGNVNVGSRLYLKRHIHALISRDGNAI